MSLSHPSARLFRLRHLESRVLASPVLSHLTLTSLPLPFPIGRWL